ncbi:MAG: polyhydroxyalkanoate synthesis regulator DNA-binding domain-containing protein [bacterium]
MVDEEIVIVKKYSNRRLYDTKRGRWINLSDIGKMIRDGINIQVLEHETDDDITITTLIQVILDELKDRRVALSAVYLLHQIFRRGEDTIEMAIEKSLIGGAEVLGIMPDDAEKIMKIFVEKGKIEPDIAESIISEYRKRYKKYYDELRGEVEVMVRETIQSLGLPTKDDMEEIKREIKEIKEVLLKK